VKIVLLTFVVLAFFGISIKAEEEDSIVDISIRNISLLEDTNLELVKTTLLYDVEYNPSFYLLEFNKGYAIVSKESGKIAQYDLHATSPFSSEDDYISVYLGPYNYKEITKEQLSRKTGLQVSYELKRINQLIHAKNELKKENDMNVESTLQWTANITPSTMLKYSGAGASSDLWINNDSNYPESSGYPENGICGTISSAGLLAYYDDHTNIDYVPSSLRAKGSYSPGTLITTLYNYIDAGLNGTAPSTLSYGINVFEGLYSSSSASSASYSIVGVNSKAKNKIDSSKPLCLGTVGELTYGNHWLLGYDYAYDDTGSLFYKCVDNWGSYNAVICSIYVTGIAYIND